MPYPDTTYQYQVNPQEESQLTRSSESVSSISSLGLDDRYTDSVGADLLLIALIGPDEERRMAAAAALADCQAGNVREFASYPASLDDVPRLLEQDYDVIVIDLDSNPDYAVELVGSICAKSSATVMVYSAKADLDLPVRCMRAGAREFLTLPFDQSTIAEAMVRVSARRRATRPPKKASGRLLVFLGAKPGEGVTTIACNFAVALAQESGQSTLLIDLNLPLGDAALNLGVVAEFSAINALQNFSRLDSSFLSKLLVKHSSGVFVLAAPGKFPQYEASDEAIDKLLAVARQDFDNVVIDLGSRLDLMGTALFKEGSTIYLVIQAGIAGLRNSNRLINQYFTRAVPKLEIVVNRFQTRSLGLGVAEDEIAKALTRPVQWKIPNDHAAVRRMQNTATPLVLEDSRISRLVRQMARSACGLPAIPEKEKKPGFSFKNLTRNNSVKISTLGEAPALTQLGFAAGQDSASTTPGATQPEAATSIPEKPVSTPPAGTVLGAETPRPFTPEDIADRTDLAAAKRETLPSVSTADQQGEPETRVYKGVTYVKGADGQWHIQDNATNVVIHETPTIAWPTPAAIAYGAALSAAELNATASVPGTFVYTPAAGEVLAAGTHALSVIFSPTDVTEYTTAHAAVSLKVTKETPAITWPTPAAIAYGAALSAAELNATASVAGTSVYTPGAGEVLAAGTHTLAVTFTPTDAGNYTAAHAAVSLTVTKETPAITWPTPAAIAYGAALSATELNATASIPGTFVYTPGAGEVLAAGTRTLAVTFTPADAVNYTAAHAAVSLTVTKETPDIAGPTPAAIAYDGAVLSAAELDAQSQPAPAKAAPAQAEKPVSQAKPASKKAPTKASAKVPPVKAAAKPPVKTPAKPPEKAATKIPAKPRVETTVKAPIETPASESPVDVVSGLDLMGTAVFQDGTTIYLVMQPGSAGVENANRMVSQYFTAGGPKPEVMVNRFESRLQGGAEGQTSTALVPSTRLPISRLIQQMTGSDSGLPAIPEKKTGFSLKNFSRNLWAKISPSGKAPAITQLRLEHTPDNDGTTPGAIQPEVTANIPEKAVYAPPAGTVLRAETPTPFVPTDIVDAKREVLRSVSTPDRQGEPETRIYRGATYMKGADGQWHLLQIQTHVTELDAKSQPAPAKAAPSQAKKPAPQAKPAPKKVHAKAPAKPSAKVAPVKTAEKPGVKTSAKPSAKVAPVKAAAKTPAKPPVKVAAKPTVKAAAKPPVESPAKVAVKSPAKSQAKTPAKPPAKVAAKPTVEAAAKPPVESPVKAAVKSPAKSPAKTPAMPPAKAAAQTPAKSPAKAPAEPPVEAAAKPPVEAPAKVPAKRSGKAAAKPSAKAPAKRPARAPAIKSARAKRKPAPAARSKAGRVSYSVKPSKPAVKKPAPKPTKKR
jgi:pilus assembly protein CpaE